MQTDHRVPTINTTAMRQQQHRKRSFSGVNPRKRDRHDLICVVCHAPAMGYNFDQITCESCKAFFRRNALNNAEKFKCRSGTEDCLVTLETRKRCKACRLKKCFEKGLRKEWIMSEEEKRTKKQKIEDNRRLRASSQGSIMFAFTPSSSPPMVPETEHFLFPNEYRKSYLDDSLSDYQDTKDSGHQYHESNDIFDIKPSGTILLNKIPTPPIFDYKTLLNDDDRLLLTKIAEDYTRAVQLNVSSIKKPNYPCLRNLNDVTDLVNEPAQISTIRMITFFKLTPEFSSLHEDDRLALVKYNLLASLYIHIGMCVDIQTGIYQAPHTTSDFCYHASELRRYSDEVYERTMILIKKLQDISSNDHLIIKLTMLIMIFSKGSDAMEPSLFQPQEIFHAQNVFTNLLWKYLDVRFDSEQTPLIFTRLIFASMEAQNIARLTKEEISKQNVNNDHLAPLMQSVLLSS